MVDFWKVTMDYLRQGKAFALDFWIVLLFSSGVSLFFFLRHPEKKRLCLVMPFLLAYIDMMLKLAILSRSPSIVYRFNFKPFWYLEVESKHALYYAILNYLFFIPFGFLVELLSKRKVWLTVILGFLFSLSIEGIQLFFKLGLAEFDDIFENTIGTLVGTMLCHLVLYAINQIDSSLQRRNVAINEKINVIQNIDEYPERDY